ncbi:hypothetical protein Tco_0563612 [Tanacetum coccineum]
MQTISSEVIKRRRRDHHRISSISKKTKSVTACNDSSKSKTLNVNAVCTECGKCVFNSNHDACVSRYLKDVNARTKKPKVVPISASKPKRKANKSVATPHKKTVASDTTIQKSKSYHKELIQFVQCSIVPLILDAKIVQLTQVIVDSGFTKQHDGNLKALVFYESKEKEVLITTVRPRHHNRQGDVMLKMSSLGLVPQRTKASDYDNSDPRAPKTKWLFYSREDIYAQQGTECIVINPFCTRVQEIGESSSSNIDNTDVHSFQPQSHDYRWTRDHPLEQVRGNPTMPVQTRRQLATNLKCVCSRSQITSLVRQSKSLGTSRKPFTDDIKAKVVMEEQE